MSDRTEELRAEADRHRQAIAEDLELVGDRVSPGRMAERRKAAVRQKLTSAREHVMGALPASGDAPSASGEDSRQLSQKASELTNRASSAASAVGDVPWAATHATQGNPLAAGLVAFGAGLLVATLLPESEQERKLAERVQPQADSIASDLGDAARQAAEEIKPQAQEAVQALTDSAKESAETVRDQAKGAAQDVKADAEQQAREVKQDLGSGSG